MVSTCPIENYCFNEGNCSIVNEVLTCACKAGVYGRQCEINNCAGQQCSGHGKCLGELNTYTCKCDGKLKCWFQ